MIYERGEIEARQLPIERYIRESGVFRYTLMDKTTITGISADSWDGFVGYLSLTTSDDRLIVSPELITCADIPFDELGSSRVIIEDRLDEIRRISVAKPNSLYLVGSPLFLEGDSKPTNGALLIKNGEMVGKTTKRSGATEYEKAKFSFSPDEPPLLIPGTKTSLLICSDLATACLYSEPTNELLERTLELFGRNSLIGKEVSHISSDAKSVLVMACWGVGGNYMAEGKEDEYYRLQLRNIALRLMRNAKLTEVVVVDRRSSSTSSNPYNGTIRLVQ